MGATTSTRRCGGMIRRVLVLGGIGAAAMLVPAGIAGATVSPTTGQPGAPGFTCPSPPFPGSTPGGSVNAGGSVFNPNGTAGTVYAGNPNTASFNNSNSTVSVSQYDVACKQVLQH